MLRPIGERDGYFFCVIPRRHLEFYTLSIKKASSFCHVPKQESIKMIVPANSNIKVTGASAKRGVGGTIAATGPHWGIAHSLAGTGANTVFGTMVSGTYANDTYANFSVTSTDVPAGNVVRLVALVGTSSEETQTIGDMVLEYKEDWD